MVGADGVIRGPAGDGRVAAQLRDDVAAACAAVLAGGAAHDGETYELSGPSAFTLAEAAERLGARLATVTDAVERLTGRPPRAYDAGWIT